MLRLQPVVEAGRDFIVLNGATSLEDVGRIVMAVANYANGHKADTPLEAATLIATSETIIVAGGLQLRGGDFEVAPACCCGLEEWRDWRNAVEGRFSPALGHDPSAGIDWEGDTAIIRTGDPELDDPAEIRRLPIPVATLAAAIDAAEIDLKSFLPRLQAWADANDIPPGIELAATFDRHFRISSPD